MLPTKVINLSRHHKQTINHKRRHVRVNVDTQNKKVKIPNH